MLDPNQDRLHETWNELLEAKAVVLCYSLSPMQPSIAVILFGESYVHIFLQVYNTGG